MFEKEAKERARDFTDNEGRQVAYECGFLDGADRMRGEMQKQGLALQSDMDKTIEQNCVLKKRIEKMKNLEEDNADLKQSLDWANEREKENTERIAELEEENEKLKKEIEISQRCWQEQKNISLDTNCKLHKAKELLREIIDTPVFNQMGCDLYENEGYTELVKEAEEFLKEKL